jgi:uncharacterized protein YbbK (DUF523 family)
MIKIKLGISSCLLGINVRYDGGHKLDSFLMDNFGVYVDYIPVCPEVESGLGVPRESMQLEGKPESPRLVTTSSKQDKTDLLVNWARKRIVELEMENLYGYIFKSDSPSCGMERVKIYNQMDIANKTGIGIFARTFMEHFPLLPVEDERRLHDRILRENFIKRLFALKK